MPSIIDTLDIRECPECGRNTPRDDMFWTYDCKGIPFRLLCHKCFQKAMAKGYDGEFYTELDECIDEDY